MKKLMFAVMMAMAAGSVLAAVTISYQGALKNADGTSVKDSPSKKITFRLYDNPTGAEDSALWGRTVVVLLNDEGLFNVELSDAAGSNPSPSTLTTSLEDVLAKYTDKLYIGLYVEDSTGEIRPRQKLLSVPMAAYAQDVAVAKKDFQVNGHAKVGNGLDVTGNATVTGALTVQGGIKGVDKSALSVDSSIEAKSGISLGGPSTVGKNVTVTVVGGATLSIESGATLKQHDVVGGIVPRGGIIMWSGRGNAVPNGWALCNGQTVKYNGVSTTTPDLRGRFIVGENNSETTKNGTFSEYTHNATGGEETHQLALTEMPSHTHNVVLSNGEQVYMRNSKTDEDDDELNVYARDGGAGPVRTAAAGGGAAHENRPPYYALCFIIKL